MKYPRQGSTFLALAAGLFLVAAGMGDALAQSGPPASSGTFDRASDFSTNAILYQIFGEAAIRNGGMVAAPLKEVFTYFNMAVITAGSLLFAYASIIGTLATAHDGSLLGKRWSSMWVPIRFGVAAAALLPLKSGLSVIQVFVFMVVGLGAGVANQIWEKFLDGFAGQTASYVNVTFNDKNLRETTLGILRAHACLASNGYTAAEYAADSPVRQASWGVTSGVEAQQVWWKFGDTSKRAYSDSLCGKIVFTMPQDFRGAWDRTTDSIRTNLVSTSYRDRVLQSERDLALAHVAATNRLITRLATIGAAVGRSMDSSPAVAAMQSEIEAAEEEYRTSYKAAVRKAIFWSNTQESSARSQDMGAEQVALAQSMRQKTGWVFAGGWFYDLAATNSRLARVVTKMPTVAGRQDEQLDTAPRERMAITNIFVNERLSQAMRTSEAPSINPMADMESGSIIGKFLAKIWFDSWSTPPWKDTTSAAKPHPLVELKEVGEWLLAGTETAWAASVVAQTGIATVGGVVATNGVSSLAGLAGAWQGVMQVFMSSVVMPLMIGLLALFVFGATVAFYVPMVPYIYWLVGVIGWLIVVFEAVLAAPLWAVMHMHPEGEGLAGQHASRGYALMLELFMRPTMMIFGLIGALLIAWPLTSLLNATFFSYIDSQQSQMNAISGFIGWIVSIMIYCGLAVTIIHKSFSLIHVIPEKVMEWVNGHARPDHPEGDNRQTRDVFVGGAATMRETVKATASNPGAGRRSAGTPGGAAGGGGGAGKGGGGPKSGRAGSMTTADRATATEK